MRDSIGLSNRRLFHKLIQIKCGCVSIAGHLNIRFLIEFEPNKIDFGFDSNKSFKLIAKFGYFCKSFVLLN